MDEIRDIIWGDLERRFLEQEYKRRYETSNLFRKNAKKDGAVFRRGGDEGQPSSQNPSGASSETSEDLRVTRHGGQDRGLPTRSGVSASGVSEGGLSAQVQELASVSCEQPALPGGEGVGVLGLEGKVSQGDGVKRPQYLDSYVRGDNIFLELLTYFGSTRIDYHSVPYVIKEDANCLLATIAASSRLSLIVEGKSRSGKSLIIDKLAELLPPVYRLKICSNKSIFSNADEINRHEFLYIAEFQSALEKNPAIKEAIKLLTEGKDATNDALGERQVINGGITVLSTGADENVRTQKRDVELSGRFVILRTGSSAEKTRAICDYQDGLAMGTTPNMDLSKDRFEKLQAYVHETLECSELSFENPFAKAFAPYLPETQKSIYYRTLYTGLVNGFTRFDRPNRMQKGKTLLTNIADVYLAYTLYHDTYCSVLRKLAADSFYSVEGSLNGIEKEEKRKEMEQELAIVETVRGTPVDWQKVWDAGYEHMFRHNTQLWVEWGAMQTQGHDVVVYDPIKKCDVKLCEVTP